MTLVTLKCPFAESKQNGDSLCRTLLRPMEILLEKIQLKLDAPYTTRLFRHLIHGGFFQSGDDGSFWFRKQRVGTEAQNLVSFDFRLF